MLTRKRIIGSQIRTGDVITSDPPRVVLSVERVSSGVLARCADARPDAYYSNGIPLTVERDETAAVTFAPHECESCTPTPNALTGTDGVTHTLAPCTWCRAMTPTCKLTPIAGWRACSRCNRQGPPT